MIKKLILAVFCVSAFAGNALSDTGKEMVISGVQVPPYIMINESGQTTGIVVEQIRQALADSPVKPVFNITNWARAYRDVQEGNIDAIIPTIKTPERQAFLEYPDTSLAHLHMVMYQPKNGKFTFSGDFKSVAGTQIGRIRNASVAPSFDAAAKDGVFTLKDRDSFGQLALSVARGRLDLIAGDELMILWAAADNGELDNIKPVGTPMAQVPVYLAISKKSPHTEYVDLIATRLLSVQNSPAYQQSLDAYSKLLREDIYQRLKKQITNN